MADDKTIWLGVIGFTAGLIILAMGSIIGGLIIMGVTAGVLVAAR